MIDVHCHLNFHAFAKDCDEVIKKATHAGITMIMNVGTKLDSSAKAVELAKTYDNLYAIVGVHPHHADKHDLSSDWLEQLETLARKPKVVAIGEIGMDFYRYQSNGIVDPKLQEEVFVQQIELAHKLALPIQIHNRHAGKEVIALLKKNKKKLKQDIPGMFHCFAGDKEILHDALDLGFYIGFDGNSTYKGLAPGETVTLDEIAKETPLERIVTETDSPFLTPEPYRGSRNEPSRVIIVGEHLAQLKGISLAEFDAISTANAQKLFAL